MLRVEMVDYEELPWSYLMLTKQIDDGEKYLFPKVILTTDKSLDEPFG